MFLMNQQFGDHDDKPESFPVPSAEPAYDFTVAVFYRKSGGGRRRTSLWLDARERGETSGIVRETARQVSREYSVLEPVRAEQAINAELDRRLAGEGRAAGSPWSARVEVTAPDEVRTMMRTALHRRYEIDSRARENELRLHKTDVLRHRWTEFLKDAAKDPTAPHALALADGTDIAKVLREMIKERRNDVGEWLTLIASIVEAHQNAGVLDLVVESDTVLRRTLEMMGIELPAPDGDALLLPDGDGR
jgi:hypothetical protein